MPKKYKLCLFIFRRDLRLDDNLSLIEACKSSETVIPCFIIDPIQVGPQNNYRSSAAIQFMIESLLDLQEQLKKQNGRLYIFYNHTEKALKDILKTVKIDAIFINKDYTPFSKKRDLSIENLCKNQKIELHSFDDALLNKPELIKNKQKKPYLIFTPYYKHARKIKTQEPIKNRFKNFYTKDIANEKSNSIFNKILPKLNNKLVTSGGRQKALKILKNLKTFKSYTKTKNYPKYSTTFLSAHNKFGTCSIREVFYAIKNNLGETHELIRQLYWRDFFTYIAYYFPHVFGEPFHMKYKDIPWDYNKKKFKKWCDGKTGFPIIDAGMRELNNSGFMHNRVRMLTASFLIKDLHIDWQWGEKYFAQKLIDYDPSVNNGNWQWVASTGCDAQPYFRIFNPWIQQKKFDPECEYIKKWIPELKTFSSKEIHKWYYQENTQGYLLPLVDHNTEAIKTKFIYKRSKQN